MGKGRLIFRVYGVHIGILAVAVALTAWFAAARLSSYYTAQNRDALSLAARWAMAHLEGPIEAGDWEGVRATSDELSEMAGIRITITQRDGTVVADTDADPVQMDNHVYRPEFEQAFQGQTGFADRFSDTLGHRRLYAAAPLMRDGRVLAVVRVSVPLSPGMTLAGVLREIVMAAAAFVLFAAIATFWIYRRIGEPLAVITQGLGRMLQGETGSRLPAPDIREFAEVTAAVNSLATELESRADRAIRQRNELEAVLGSMVEGIIAVDDKARILNINRAAAVFFDINPDKVAGMSIEEAIRNPDLHIIVRRTLRSRAVVEGEIVIYQEGQRFLHAHGTALQQPAGAVVVLNDVTRVRGLEEARSRFVANVSHELRTPITSIKGYAETLMDGAYEDPESLQRFLSIITRQAQRLNSLIEDLLTLSRIEQEERNADILMETASVAEVAEGAVVMCRHGAEAKGVALRLTADAGAVTRINAPLLQQAVTNLIDNAIKYSDEGAAVEITVSRGDGAVVVTVADSGCGIDPVHLPRLFERFYRVDEARSRKLGGTGLGLAIVKHITLIHGGRNGVESAPGKGSRFTIELPVVQTVARTAPTAL